MDVPLRGGRQGREETHQETAGEGTETSAGGSTGSKQLLILVFHCSGRITTRSAGAGTSTQVGVGAQICFRSDQCSVSVYPNDKTVHKLHRHF